MTELPHPTIIPIFSVNFFEAHGVRDYYQCVLVCMCVSVSRATLTHQKIAFDVLYNSISGNYKRITRTSADIDICESRETPLSVPFWNE